MSIHRYVVFTLFFFLICFIGCTSEEDDDKKTSSDSGGSSDDDDNDDANDDDASNDDDDDTSECDENNPDWTVGLLYCTPDASDGYTLIAPTSSFTTYLIDIHGRLVHSWENINFPGDSAPYLLEDGSLLRSVNSAVDSHFDGASLAGGIERLTWDGELIWDFSYYGSNFCSHHDIELLPNGNVLMIVWQLKDSDETIAAGRDPNMLIDDELWPDSIIEIEPDGPKGGNVVWEWHMWDHLIQDFDPGEQNYGMVEDHPELININFGGPGADWTHSNAVDYNSKLDQIVLSVHNFGEIWVIDHSTTTAQAAGHTGGNSGMGGDILYRWGNPAAYQAGNESDQMLFAQHDAQWIPESYPGGGNFLVFNNLAGQLKDNYSTVDEWIPPVDSNGMYEYATGNAYGPDSPLWTYIADNPPDFFSGNISGAHRLSTGNTLICSGNQGHIFEVTEEGKTVWSYINPVAAAGILNQGDPVNEDGVPSFNMLFRSYRHAPDYPAFDGRDLTPGDYIEGASE